MKKRKITQRDRMFIDIFYNSRCKCRINGKVSTMKYSDIMTELLDNNNKLGIEVTDSKELNRIILELKHLKE